jgi:hypothetical protein
MTAVVRLAAAVATLLIPGPPAPEAPVAQRYSTIGDALAAVIPPGAGTVVLGVGELHQTTDTAALPSSLSRFTGEILPMIAGRTSDLIVETWITDGACGPAEAATIAGVATTTERPAATESEIVTLLRRAKDAGVRPHVLHVGCADYQLLSPPSSSTPSSSSKRGATVDFQRMLTLIERQLRATITKVLAARPRLTPPRWSWFTAARFTTTFIPIRRWPPSVTASRSSARPVVAIASWTSTCPSTWSEAQRCGGNPGSRSGNAMQGRASRREQSPSFLAAATPSF